MKKLPQMLNVAVIALSISSSALAIDIDGGPIWNNDDANTKCPLVCSGLSWSGNWKTTVPGEVSACDCDQSASGGYSKLVTQFREGENECLEGNQADGSINSAAYMDKCQNVTGQLWKATPAENGYFKLTTQFREGENECLEGNQVNGSFNGAAFMSKCEDVTGQLWKATSAGNGYFKLTTQFRESDNECLEGNQVNGSMNSAAFMDNCQDVSGQLWKFKPAVNARPQAQTAHPVAHAVHEPSPGAQGTAGAKGTFEFKPKDRKQGTTSWWKDSDGIAPGVAGCHIGTDSEGKPNGRMFGEACLPDGLLVESNPGASELHKHDDDTGHPDTYDCREWCMGEGYTGGSCRAAAAPPCESSAICACD